MSDAVPERGSAGVKFPPPFIFIIGLGLGYALEALLPSTELPTAVRLVAGLLLLMGGIGLQASFLALFRRAGTHIEPWKPTTAIVTDGPYRFTRNPAYLGMALIYSGVAVLSSALWAFATLAVVLVIVDRAVIAREERYLERAFGQEYVDYLSRVRRWI